MPPTYFPALVYDESVVELNFAEIKLSAKPSTTLSLTA